MDRAIFSTSRSKRLVKGSETSHNMLKKAIFLDRDGVINRKLPEDRYVRNSGEFELLPGVPLALKILKGLGYLVVIVTNQRGIARGFMTEDDLSDVHDFMRSLFRTDGMELDGLYYCPHDKTDYCDCRKPAPGMIFEAERDLGIDLEKSFMVGDSLSDVEAARTAGVQPVMISAVREASDIAPVFSSLLDFAEFLQKKGFRHD